MNMQHWTKKLRGYFKPMTDKPIICDFLKLSIWWWCIRKLTSISEIHLCADITINWQIKPQKNIQQKKNKKEEKKPNKNKRKTNEIKTKITQNKTKSKQNKRNETEAC